MMEYSWYLYPRTQTDPSSVDCLSMTTLTQWSNKRSQRPHTFTKPCQGQYGLDPESVRIRIRTSDPHYFQNLTWTSLSWVHLHKIFMKSDHSLPRYKPNCGKIQCPISQCWRILQHYNFGSGSGGSRLPKFNRFFLVHRYTSGKIVMKICLVVLRKVANRQTDKQEQSQTASRPPRRMWSGSGVHGSGVRIRIRT